MTSARSLSSAGTLMTTAGRTLAAIPRSTSQTSPRCGDSLRLLVSIEFDEEPIRGRHQIVVLGEIVRSNGRSTEQFSDEFCPVFVRQGVEFVQQPPRGLRHGFRLALDRVAVKFRS